LNKLAEFRDYAAVAL